MWAPSASNHPAVLSLILSAAFGEALLFLATCSELELNCKRVVLTRELSRMQVRRELGRTGSAPIPQRLTAGEPQSVIDELRRAASHGALSALMRYRYDADAITA